MPTFEMINRKAPAIGGLTVPLHFMKSLPGVEGIRDAVAFGKRARWGVVQLAAFPTKDDKGKVRDFAAATVDADSVIAMDKARKGSVREAVKEILGDSGMRLQIAFCDNPMDSHFSNKQTEKVIQAGELIGAEAYIGFIGTPFNLARAVGAPTSGPEAIQFFREMLHGRIEPRVNQALNAGMSYELENCTMWFANGANGTTEIGNFYCHPETWDIVHSELPKVKMHIDPSHLRNMRDAQESDPAATGLLTSILKRYGHVIGIGSHAKDAVDDPELPNVLSVGSAFNGNTHTKSKWQAKAPGNGAINWLQWELDMAASAPQCTSRVIELEDLAVDYTNREQCEAAMIKATQFLRGIMAQVYSVPDEREPHGN